MLQIGVMPDTNITCPKCGAEIPLTEAVSHGVREQLESNYQKQRSELNSAITAREQKLTIEKAVLDHRAQSIDVEVAKRLEAERKKFVTEAARQAEKKLGTEINDLQSQLVDKNAKLKVAEAAELDLRKKHRELEEAKTRLELDVARRLDTEREKIRRDAAKSAAEVERLKLSDKNNIIKGLQEQISALQQRAEQGSTQLQGETLELEIENQLCSSFAFDEIIEVKKGQRGADMSQLVRTKNGIHCGTILWEAKRARNWSADWPGKLKADQRMAKAELAVIVTTCPPEEIQGIGQLDGVWVCEPSFTVVLATALRQGLISAAAHRAQQANRTNKMATMYDHLCSLEFRQHVEAIVESFMGLKEQLAAEQRAFARQWKEREQQLHKAINHIAMLYGGVQGIAGREALPAIQSLALQNTR